MSTGIRTAQRALVALPVWWLAFVFLVSTVWLRKNFGSPGFEQILFQFYFGSPGIIEGDKGLVYSFIKTCLAYPLAIVIFLMVAAMALETCMLHRWPRTAWADVGSRHSLIRLIHLPLRLVFNLRVAMAILLIGLLTFLTATSFWSWLTRPLHSGFIDNHYVTPSRIENPTLKKNLVLIYVESLEATYRDSQLFGANLIAPLDAVTEGWVEIPTYAQMPGTGWTMAAIVATQCGVPLKPQPGYPGLHKDVGDGNSIGRLTTSFLQGLTCLGDLLSSAGYRNVFMQGASLSFAGGGLFFANHGYQEALGREELEGVGATDHSRWGLYDEHLFQYAKVKIDDLVRQGTPYNLTILTMDTHGPEGFIGPQCRRQGVMDFKGLIQCNIGIVARFIEYMVSKRYMENTNIVILGDHLAMKNPLSSQIELAPKRSLFNKFLSSQGLAPSTDVMFAFDVYPSILQMLGFEVPHGRLGLGLSVFGGSLESAIQFHSNEAFELGITGDSILYVFRPV